MSRYCGPRLRIVRRLGTALPGLINTDSDLRRPYPPGQHGPTRRGKLSDFALRLREKQKLRFHYGISEKQLKRYMMNSFKGHNNPGLKLLSTLEFRLDNVVFRMGLASTIRFSRQMVSHGHIIVNEKKVDIPSYIVKIGDIVELSKKSKMKEKVSKMKVMLKLPSYLEVNLAELNFKIIAVPVREDTPIIVNEQLIVEYYSGC